MSSATGSKGEVDFVYQGESFKTSYTVFGELASGTTPLVALHGGPGIPHQYLLPHTRLATERGIPVILYDQIGCGKSTHLKDKPAEFWSVELFVAELVNLLEHLGVSDNFSLLGHSWGGMLAQEYVAAIQPKGLRKLVLADSLASMPLWEVSVNKLLQGFLQETQDAIKKHEAEGTTESKGYQEIMQVFYQKHICKLNPWPQDLLEAFGSFQQDPTVYATMLGPSEFTITGMLKTWSMVDRLHTITVPTLVLNSVDDEAQDECVAPLFHKIPRAKWVQFAKSSHMPFFEEQDRYMQVVGDFLGDM